MVYELILYRVFAEHGEYNDEETFYEGYDENEAYETYDLIDIHDIKNEHWQKFGCQLTIESFKDSYRFVYDLDDFESADDYPLEVYYDDETYYEKIDSEITHLNQRKLYPINEESDLLLNKVQEHFKRKYDARDRKYIEIDVEGSEGEFIGCIKLRLADHTWNVFNNDRFDKCNFYLSVVIANKNFSANRFGSQNQLEGNINEIELIFNTDTPKQKIIDSVNQEIDEAIKRIKKNSNANNPDVRFNNGGQMKKIKRGGITYGRSHADGGIPVKNASTGQMLEVEGGEGIINKRSMASGKKVKLNGKEMSLCEAVSELNQMEGGVQFNCDDVEDRQFIQEMANGGELERGTRTEKEHIQVLKDLYEKRITPSQATKRIAKDHLKEDRHYYSKLAKMERKMAKGGNVGKSYNIPSSEDLVEMVTDAKGEAIKKQKQLGIKVVVGRYDGYYIGFKNGDNSDLILSTRPSRRKIIELIERNPNATEITFVGSILVADRVGEEMEIIDDFAVTLWKRPINIEDAIGIIFQYTDTKQDPQNRNQEILADESFYMVVDQKDSYLYQDRPKDEQYIYLNSYNEKNGQRSSSRIKKSLIQELENDGEIIIIEPNSEIKNELMKSMPDYENKMAKGGKMLSKEQQREKVRKVMREFKEHKLHSGSKHGKIVTNPNQAIAIALSEAKSKKMENGGQAMDMAKYQEFFDKITRLNEDFRNKSAQYTQVVDEGIETKNNKKLDADERKTKIEALRKKALEKKDEMVSAREKLQGLSNMDSPFYAPKLAEGGQIPNVNYGQAGFFKVFPVKEDVSLYSLPKGGFDVQYEKEENGEYEFRVTIGKRSLPPIGILQRMFYNFYENVVVYPQGDRPSMGVAKSYVTWHFLKTSTSLADFINMLRFANNEKAFLENYNPSTRSVYGDKSEGSEDVEKLINIINDDIGTYLEDMGYTPSKKSLQDLFKYDGYNRMIIFQELYSWLSENPIPKDYHPTLLELLGKAFTLYKLKKADSIITNSNLGYKIKTTSHNVMWDYAYKFDGIFHKPEQYASENATMSKIVPRLYYKGNTMKEFIGFLVLLVIAKRSQGF